MHDHQFSERFWWEIAGNSGRVSTFAVERITIELAGSWTGSVDDHQNRFELTVD